ncbi:MAG: hypothetical protein ACD_71C00007G0004 [uncultured bacterium (gcode 4)]|uniref:Uncharacterized protein n=1 Tax=uncultured bacterium (gcode 4) TaxID=1234023 RepID=K1Z5J3_9BACT|nr:MAG: hypothetical protein ACD_71C00007G0004 [uncultured bacterium (gcode 4)]
MLHNFLKFIKKHSWFISIIPVALVIGMTTQIGLISTYNAWSCFDWSQVPNDTAILFLPVCSLFLGWIAFVWRTPDSKWWYVWRFFITIAVIVACEYLLAWIGYANPFTFLLWSSFIFGAILSLLTDFSKWLDNKIGDFSDKRVSVNFFFGIFPWLIIMALLTIYMVFRGFSVLFYDGIYKGSYVINHNAKSATWATLPKLPLHYLNSKCVMYGTWLLITNNESAEVLVNTSSIPITSSK